MKKTPSAIPKNIIRPLAIITLICLALSSCGGPAASGVYDGIYITGSDAEMTGQMTAMDTFMTVSVRGGGVTADELRHCMELVPDIESSLSVTLPGSEISAVNAAKGKTTAVSDMTRDIISRSLEMSAMTNGAFDITAYPLVRAWGFTAGEYRVPGEDEIESLLGLVGWEKLSLDGGSVTLPEGGMIDLGAIAKGYAGDVLRDALADAGAVSALLSLGGNIVCLGSKPDGSKWRVAIRDPQDLSSYIGYVDVCDTSVVTSGGYERQFTGDDGKTYWHIIDPSTGYPARSGVISSTVISEDGAMADALSTALFVMGVEKAAELRRGYDSFEYILVTDGGGLVVSEGISRDFTPYGERDVVISR